MNRAQNKPNSLFMHACDRSHCTIVSATTQFSDMINCLYWSIMRYFACSPFLIAQTTVYARIWSVLTHLQYANFICSTYHCLGSHQIRFCRFYREVVVFLRIVSYPAQPISTNSLSIAAIAWVHHFRVHIRRLANNSIRFNLIFFQRFFQRAKSRSLVVERKVMRVRCEFPLFIRTRANVYVFIGLKSGCISFSRRINKNVFESHGLSQQEFITIYISFVFSMILQ